MGHLDQSAYRGAHRGARRMAVHRLVPASFA
jgi:hypothetical protein